MRPQVIIRHGRRPNNKQKVYAYMSVEKKLAEWHAKSLIDDVTLASIHAYEAAKPSHVDAAWRYGLIALAVLCVALGGLFIIAANWAAIPFALKLGVTAALNIALGGWIVHRFARKTDNTPNHYATEIPLILLAAGQMGLMALIGQYLHSSAMFETVVLYWFILTAPMLLIAGRGKASAALFLAAGWFVSNNSLDISKDTLISIYTIGSVICFILGHSTMGRTLRTHWASVLRITGLIGLAYCAIACHVNYDLHLLKPNAFKTDLLAAGGLCALYLLYIKRQPQPVNIFPILAVLYMTFGLVALHEMILPFMMPWKQIGFTLVFCVYFIGLGWLARRYDRTIIVILSVLAIGGRLVVYFLSAYNHMLFSGIGLITVGIATIAALRVLTRKKKQVTAA